MPSTGSKLRFSFQTKVLLPVLAAVVLLLAVTFLIVDRYFAKELLVNAAQNLKAANDMFVKSLGSRHENIVLQFGNMSLTAQGRAVEDGAKGDTIRVLNTTSNRQVEGIVVAPDTVSVSIGPRLAALAPQ